MNLIIDLVFQKKIMDANIMLEKVKKLKMIASSI